MLSDAIALNQTEEQIGNTNYFVLTNNQLPPVSTSNIRDFPMRERCTYESNGFVCDVPDGHHFMMGDNRDNSDDSRYWGFVPSSYIVGKVNYVFSAKD